MYKETTHLCFVNHILGIADENQYMSPPWPEDVDRILVLLLCVTGQICKVLLWDELEICTNIT